MSPSMHSTFSIMYLLLLFCLVILGVSATRRYSSRPTCFVYVLARCVKLNADSGTRRVCKLHIFSVGLCDLTQLKLY